MKKIIILIVVVFSLSACSSDTNDITQKEQNANLEDQAKGFLCGPGYHLEFTVFDELRLFKKGGCDDGFGFCFGIRLNISFDCVRNTLTSVPNSNNVSYDNTTQQLNALGIADPKKKEITFYFHKDIINSPNHNPSDFTTLDVDNDVYMNDKVKLIGGSYPKVVEGTFYKYNVPYTNEN